MTHYWTLWWLTNWSHQLARKNFMSCNQCKKCIIRKSKKNWIRWSRFPEDVLPSPQQNHSDYIFHHVYTRKSLFLFFYLNHFLSFSRFLLSFDINMNMWYIHILSRCLVRRWKEFSLLFMASEKSFLVLIELFCTKIKIIHRIKILSLLQTKWFSEKNFKLYQ